jgi:3-deoxy-manno-octulosonate cytidylyltransferase (CMP-KDO synthetase)
MQTAIVIPARLESTRFPGKALVRIHGKSLVQYAIDAAKQSKLADAVLLATDSRVIADDVNADEISVCQMGGQFHNGTERAAGAIDKCGWDPRRVVILQCDEPDITGEDIDRLIETSHGDAFATAAFHGAVTDDRNQVKVSVGRMFELDSGRIGAAYYFSRAPLAGAMIHAGLYIVERSHLDIWSSEPGPIEAAEGLEQLRVLEQPGEEDGDTWWGWQVLDLGRPVRSVNVPDDLEQFATKHEDWKPKPWGRTKDLGGGLHVIDVDHGGKCSLHRHNHKFNQFIPRGGSFRLEREECHRDITAPSLPAIIPPGELHRFHAGESQGFTAYESYWTADGSEPDLNDIERMEEPEARC